MGALTPRAHPSLESGSGALGREANGYSIVAPPSARLYTSSMMTDDIVRSDFIREIIEGDRASGKHKTIVTRFPPEPNGYLHIGHAKSICLNFGIAEQFGGRCHLRFDDTNPLTEETEYEESIQEDVRWLGFSWGEHLFHASDYFDRLYAYAEELIEKGLAYVCSLTEEQMREYRGSVMEPGRASPDRDRSPEENLALFRQMRDGAFKDGERTLRAKIDMSAANMKMRDPPIYRIRHARHHRAGDKWCIYPMYDFAHCLSDSIEGITHSICTLEFENNRELYDWILDHLDVPRPQPRQYEFARLNLSYTVMSKRKLLTLVKDKLVAGWDDPRMPTLSGLRRRGVTPEAIRKFADDIGVAKANSMVEVERLEHWIREDLNLRSPRAMAVLRPLKVTIESFPEGEVEEVSAEAWPADVLRERGGAQETRKLPFSRTLYIERDDFMETPTAGFKRLSPGSEVRLRFAYVIKCERVVKDAGGEVTEIICSHDPATKGGATAEGRRVPGTLHWVSADHALDCEVRLYDRLFSTEKPDADKERDFKELLNPRSLEVVRAKAEPSLKDAKPGERFQLERQGYFFVDPKDSKEGAPVLNRTVQLRDTWAKQAEDKRGGHADKRAEKEARKKAQAAGPRVVELGELGRELKDKHGLSDDDARLLSESDELRAWFVTALDVVDAPKAIANWLVNDVQAALKERPLLPFGGKEVGELVALVESGTISSAGAKAVFERMVEGAGAPAAIVDELSLRQVSDTAALEPVVDEVIAENPEEAQRFREGKKALLGFFVGQVMKKSGGKADPKAVQGLVAKRLG